MVTRCHRAGVCRVLLTCMILLGRLASVLGEDVMHNNSKSVIGIVRLPANNPGALDKVHGPVCFNCHGADSPGTCTDLTVCKVGEVCMLHEMVSGTTRSYEASCQSSMMCTMIGQMASSPAVIGKKRAGPPCHVCCSGDFCNNDCHAENSPPTTPSGPVETRLLCYSCSQQDNPADCRHHVTCDLGQRCIIRESGVTSSGHKQYQSSCTSKNVCDTLLHLTTGPTDHSFCYTCCDSDLCNNHCDYHNAAATTSPTTVMTSPPTTTTPLAPTHPTTTISGPKCWSCTNMQSVADCYHLATCAPDQVCSLQRFSDTGGGVHYEASCQNKQACAQYQQMLQSHFGAGGYCKTCCSVDRCNDFCPLTPISTTHAPATTQHSGGLHCYNCANMADPTRCRQTTMCGKDQVCMLHELIQNGKTSHQYTSSCRSLTICNYIGGLLQEDTARSGVEHCHECCTSDLCNNKCTKGQVVTSPPHHVATTHAPAQTTQGIGSMLMCYSCSSTDDPKFCSHIVPCLPGEICTVHQIGTQGAHGKPQYTSSCENKQRCTMYRDLAAHGLSSCHTCCESNFCNTHCESQTTTAVVPQTTPASHGPLECYSCPLIYDPKGCPTVKKCDAGQVCMLHEKTSTTAGATSFEASCQEKAVCETLVRVLQSQHQGLGHLFCTYCCNTSRCNNHCEMATTTPLPVVNGGWSGWSAWSVCTQTCGSQGVEVRTRTCTNPAPKNHGVDCHGDSTQQQTCNDTPCPVDGFWSSWNTWSSCTHTCGTNSMQMRTRSCDHPAPSHGGSTCTGQGVEIHACTAPHCPIDGAWSSWNHWSPCSKSCGSGAEIRTRHCSHPAPQYGGHTCSGSSLDTKSCQIKLCPVDGAWAAWSHWAGCSVTCGSGSKSRSRTCTNPPPVHGGQHCGGLSSETNVCHKTACPVDGQWSSWAAWSSCSHTCGSGGQQTRARTCDHPAPAHGGASCVGAGSGHKACSLAACPVDGAWSHWTGWSACSATCGSGATKTRARTCDHPAPAHGGADCSGSHTAHHSCPIVVCPIDGAWSHWTGWSACSATCGSGVTKTRARTCDHPAPAHGGTDCSGSHTDHQSCPIVVCPTRAPLECYSCDLMTSPNGCRNTVYCDAGQVCMLHETSSSMTSTKYYEAKCERNTVCKSVVNILHAQTGSGHVFCTYCCSESRCNNHCDLAQLTSARAIQLTPPSPSTSQQTPSELCHASAYNYVSSVDLCFKIYEVLTSYSGAIDNCQKEGGNLAIVHSDVEWQLVAFQLTLVQRIAGMSLFMGGYDVFNNGSYVWPDGSAMTYTHWDQGEPLVSTKDQQMPCVVVDMTDMTWHTDDCQSQRPFICTKHVTPVSTGSWV